MGLLSGTLSFKVYKVLEQLPEDYIELFNSSIKKLRFKPLSQDSKEIITKGWVYPFNPIDGIEKVDSALIDEYFLFALRIDKKNLNKKILKAHLTKRIEEVKKEKKLNKIPKDLKSELEQETRNQLIKIVTPSTSIIEIAWNLNSNKLYFGSFSKTRNEDFIELFIQTFNMPIIPYEPIVFSQDILQKSGGENSIKKFISIKPAVFSPIVKRKNTEAEE